MRTKRIKPSQLLWLAVTVWLVKVLILGFENELGSYIHPRFNTFTIVLCAVGLLVYVYTLIKHPQPKDTTSDWLASVIILVSLATAMVPPLALSASSAVTRGNASFGRSAVTLSARYDQFTIKEWSGLLSQTTDTVSLVGKPVAFEAFIGRPLSENEPALLARFSVTCCAIDAQPITLPAQGAALQSLPKNQWVRIKGAWVKDPASTIGIAIAVNQAEVITQPKEPYVY